MGRTITFKTVIRTILSAQIILSLSLKETALKEIITLSNDFYFTTIINISPTSNTLRKYCS